MDLLLLLSAMQVAGRKRQREALGAYIAAGGDLKSEAYQRSAGVKQRRVISGSGTLGPAGCYW